jgi:ribosomal protein S27AE
MKKSPHFEIKKRIVDCAAAKSYLYGLGGNNNTEQERREALESLIDSWEILNAALEQEFSPRCPHCGNPTQIKEHGWTCGPCRWVVFDEDIYIAFGFGYTGSLDIVEGFQGKAEK